MQSEKINTIYNTNVKVINLEEYKYQKNLTLKLDNINDNFDQNTINEIVLWKVNRYAELNKKTLSLLNKIRKKDRCLDKSLTEQILLHLLGKNQQGIQLAMASTILRFKNPNIYQILDQRVYRYIFGEKLNYSLSNIHEQIELYFKYLEKLHLICEEYNIHFSTADRLLYLLDKKYNGKLNLKGY
ncbi:hypothetical protein [Christiangramia crocea]|uniref:Uncharacterized protein n=1 Tax=Christiangramia crocea TaxID=2904124 RepID=A0A9X2A564_9FLAO|nr:hypothetical protein [Gramella crocea]MCG9971159.1 hypothetical protein [Gramella crocea]